MFVPLGFELHANDDGHLSVYRHKSLRKLSNKTTIIIMKNELLKEQSGPVNRESHVHWLSDVQAPCPLQRRGHCAETL